MNLIYSLYNSDAPDAGVGISSAKGLIRLPEKEILEWSPPLFIVEDGGFTDYQNNNKSLRLCSKRMKKIIDEVAPEDSRRQWLDVDVMLGDEKITYFALHFTEGYEVLNTEKSTYSQANGKIIKVVLESQKCHGLDLFRVPGYRDSTYISHRLKLAFQKNGLTGMEYKKALQV